MPDNDLNTRDDNWQDLLNLEDDKVTTLNDAYLDNVILDDWIDKDEDSIDFMRFRIEEPAKVSFTVNADTTAKYTIYRYVDDELKKLETELAGPEVTVTVDLHFNSSREAVIYTCDLSTEYVHINADYTT